MATKTLRPLKRGDKCWIRIQGKGKPVLAVYISPSLIDGSHWVWCGAYSFYCRKNPAFIIDDNDAIFVAKPIPKDAP